MCRFVTLFFVVLLMGLCLTDVSAREPLPVLLISVAQCCETEYWEAAEIQASSEFLQVGYPVLRVPGSVGETAERRIELERLTLEHNAIGAVRILRRNDVHALVEMWIRDSDSHAGVHRRVLLSDTQSRESADVAAWKTLEAFQGGLQDLRMAAILARTETPVVAVIDNPSVDENRVQAFFVGTGIGAVWFLRDGPIQAAPLLLLGWMPRDRFQLQFEGGIPVIGTDIVEGSDRARVRGGFASFKAVFGLLPGRRIQLLAGGVVGINAILLSGRSRSDAPEYRTGMLSALLGATVQLSVIPRERLRLTLFLDAGTQIPRTRVMFGEQWVETFGAAVLRFGLCMSVLR
jgi:hypothetical protein